jgi:NADPH:quinone reductase-like Zn-dependent oxidoreductase
VCLEIFSALLRAGPLRIQSENLPSKFIRDAKSFLRTQALDPIGPVTILDLAHGFPVTLDELADAVRDHDVDCSDLLPGESIPSDASANSSHRLTYISSMMGPSMKAVVQHSYGSPEEALSVREIDQPAIGDGEILLEVHAASVNALDWHMTRGMPYLIRFFDGLRVPRNRVRGVDVAGRVVATGKDVTRFKPGDEVFGGANGSFAELAVGREERLAPLPAGLTFEESAALYVAGMTALQGLRERARLRGGERIVIHGAGGGVGIFAVQIAKSMGAHVTAVTRTESVELVRSLGADTVIDYRVEDFTRRNERYDVLFDIGGSRPFLHYRRVMTREGRMVIVGGPAGGWLAPADRMLKGLFLSPFISQKIHTFVSRDDTESVTMLGEMARAGTIRPLIERRYALEDAAQAIRHVGEGRARGKVTIQVRA